jgi:hypothetical protein
MMISQMFSMRSKYHKIINVVIGVIAIYMVDYFFVCKRSFKVYLHNLTSSSLALTIRLIVKCLLSMGMIAFIRAIAQINPSIMLPCGGHWLTTEGTGGVKSFSISGVYAV